jgi:hypothetical protein
VVSEDPLDAITQPEQTLILFPSGNKKVGISMMQVMHYTVGNASWQEKQQQQQKTPENEERPTTEGEARTATIRALELRKLPSSTSQNSRSTVRLQQFTDSLRTAIR